MRTPQTGTCDYDEERAASAAPRQRAPILYCHPYLQPMSRLGAFVDGVRSGRIRQPNQRKFKPAQWQAAYDALPEPTGRDASLLLSGLVAHLMLSDIRARADAVGPLPMGLWDGAALMCAVINRNVWQAGQKLRAHLTAQAEGTTTVNMQAIYDRILPSAGGGDTLDVAQGVEMLIDGGTHPLRSILKGGGTGEPQVAAGDDLGVIRAAKVLTQAGQYYAWIEHVWRQCAYGDQELAADHGRLVFRPVDAALARRRALAAHRGGAMVMQRALHVTRDLAQRPDLDRAVRARRVLLKAGHESPYRVRVGTLRAGGAEQMDAAQWLRGRLMFEAFYPAELLTTPLPEYGNLTADTMLRAWEAMAPFVDQVDRTLHHPDRIVTVKALGAFAPTVSEGSLVAGWIRALGVTRDEARALVRAFTFRGEPRDALWSRPLVRVGSDTLAFVITAVTGPNVRWVVETWLRNGGIDLDARGPWFEADVRAGVGGGLAQSPLPDVWVSGTAIEASGQPVNLNDPETEEIDMVVRIGCCVLVCEIKCSLVPVDDRVAEMNYRGVLEKGAVQARRKAQFLAANPERVAAVIDSAGVHDPADLRFVPVLITNVAEGVGSAVDGVAVTDESLLRQYIQPGYFLRAASFNPAGEYEGTPQPFYDGAAEAEANVEGYLLDPPQLTAFEPLLHEVEMSVGTIAGRDIVQVYPVVDGGSPAPPPELSNADAPPGAGG